MALEESAGGEEFFDVWGFDVAFAEGWELWAEVVYADEEDVGFICVCCSFLCLGAEGGDGEIEREERSDFHVVKLVLEGG